MQVQMAPSEVIRQAYLMPDPVLTGIMQLTNSFAQCCDILKVAATGEAHGRPVPGVVQFLT